MLATAQIRSFALETMVLRQHLTGATGVIKEAADPPDEERECRRE